MAELDLTQDTMRQRRNLVVTSILLIFIQLADVTFGNKLTFLGASLNIGNPELIYDGLLVFQLYFLWRFYQYFVSDQAYRALLNQYSDHMRSLTRNKIVELICKPRGLKGLSGDNYLYSDLVRKDLFTYSTKASTSDDFDPAIGISHEKNFVAEISFLKLQTYRALYTIGYVLRARILTDYFVPYSLVIYSIFLEFI